MPFSKMYFPRRALQRTPKNEREFCRLSGEFRRLNRGPRADIGGVWGGEAPQLECGGLGGTSPPVRETGFRVQGKKNHHIFPTNPNSCYFLFNPIPAHKLYKYILRPETTKHSMIPFLFKQNTTKN